MLNLHVAKTSAFPWRYRVISSARNQMQRSHFTEKRGVVENCLIYFVSSRANNNRANVCLKKNADVNETEYIRNIFLSLARSVCAKMSRHVPSYTLLHIPLFLSAIIFNNGECIQTPCISRFILVRPILKRILYVNF